MKSRAAAFLFLAMGLVLAACPRTTSQPEVGGETNWLRACTDSGGCGVGSCVCGVCTAECSSESQCSGAFAGSCVSTTSQVGASACLEAEQMPAGVCLPGCGSDAECGAGFACRDSVCVTTTSAGHFDVAQEPPAERDAQQAEHDAAQAEPDAQTPVPPECEPTAPLCPSEAGTADAGMQDAGTQDATSMVCDCASEEVSLECVCAQGQMACRTFEQATTNVFCQAGFPGRLSVERGCGYARVNLGGGLGSRTYVYQGADNTLVGASLVDDLPYGSCARNAYRTRLQELTTCADYSICDLCPNGANPCQL